MSSLDSLVASILEGLSPVLNAALRPHLANAAPAALALPDIVRIAHRISLLREELGALEVDLQRALRAPLPQPETPKGAPPRTIEPTAKAPSPPTLKDRILELLEKRPAKPLPYKRIAILLRAPEKTVHATLSNIVSQGLAARPAKGRYQALGAQASGKGAAPRVGSRAPTGLSTKLAAAPIVAPRPGSKAAKRNPKSASLYERVFVEVGRRGSEAFRMQEIVDAIGGKPGTVRTFLERMVARGAARKISKGLYASSFGAGKTARGIAPSVKKAKRAPTRVRSATRSTKPTRTPSTKRRAKVQRPAPGQGIGDRTLALLAKRSGPMLGRDIAEALGTALPSVFAELSKLTKAGRVRRVGAGEYALPASSSPPSSRRVLDAEEAVVPA